MTGEETRTVGKRGRVILPEQLRENLGTDSGEEITIREEWNEIVIEKAVSRAELAEGYRRRAEQHGAIAEEMAGTSREASAYLADSSER
ncbi:AbrB/MazE/SpoVT family DNA-binding domain-containing protein [Halomontanus rarus]|uniref:AbrB/MazE/SpoVT family DNA-binding domain-containing protein n=1 Tax=Halomontanus rarus TaxID=3034020 RepID=UPI001A99A84C